MQRTGDSWKIVDVPLDGLISRVAVQRSDFRALMVSGGTAGLLDSLRRQTAGLEALS
jgi:phospholipid transport system substrate-binding protein